MAETDQNAQQQIDPALTEPQGEQKPTTDWKAEARKWEARAKENKEKADLYNELEESNKTELQKANDRAAKAEQEAKDAKAKLEHNELVSKVSKETGIPADLLHGSSEDELKDSAEAIQSYINNQKPSFPPDQGGSTVKSNTASKESIEQLKSPIERVRARAANASLYQ